MTARETVTLVVAALGEALPFEAEGLSATLRERYRTIAHPLRRRQWLAGRAAALASASYLLDRPVALADLCETAQGPVMVREPGCRLSISHSANIVAAAASRLPCGVDVEFLDPWRDIAALAAHALAPAEARWIASDPDQAGVRFYLLWTLREAAFKAGIRGSVLGGESLCRDGALAPGFSWWTRSDGEHRITVAAAVPFSLRHCSALGSEVFASESGAAA